MSSDDHWMDDKTKNTVFSRRKADLRLSRTKIPVIKRPEGRENWSLGNSSLGAALPTHLDSSSQHQALPGYPPERTHESSPYPQPGYGTPSPYGQSDAAPQLLGQPPADYAQHPYVKPPGYAHSPHQADLHPQAEPQPYSQPHSQSQSQSQSHSYAQPQPFSQQQPFGYSQEASALPGYPATGAPPAAGPPIPTGAPIPAGAPLGGTPPIPAEYLAPTENRTTARPADKTKPASKLSPEELEALALLDPATQAFNLRHLASRLAYEVDRVRICGGTVAVMVVAVDNLRSIGLEFGPGGLDRVIVLVAALLLNGLRPIDIVGRLNEDRFAVVLPNMDNESLDKLGHDLCQALSRMEVKHQWHSFKFTVSIGIAVTSAEIADSDSLLALADMNAHDATTAGGNAVCFEC